MNRFAFVLFLISPCVGNADICLSPNSPDWLELAAKDLSVDIFKGTGKNYPVVRTDEFEGPNSARILIGSLEDPLFENWIQAASPAVFATLAGKDEAFEVLKIDPDSNTLVFAGSDYRGAMRGIYAFSKEVMGIDPTYLWTGIEPITNPDKDWLATRLSGSEPSFKYRGWFINDEDLLTGWIESGGKRHIDYRHYAHAVDPKVMAMVCETAVRLGYNLIIPASFLDIDNPPERKLADEAAKRGLTISMHHIEPLGVSAFTYFNYWKERGEKPLFSYYSAPKKLEETWRHYARLWSEYPNVIWQLGLRGIADRPMWLADSSIPKTDKERGAIMTAAIELQRQIVREVSKDPKPIMTTTLWGEGALFFKEGHMKIPDDTMIIFSDNSPGRVWQTDFYEMPREPNRKYGVYFHHLLWDSGPHMVQGVSPNEQGYLFNQAYDRGAHEYAILNVSNIREIVMGLSASAQTLTNIEAFDANRFLTKQCKFWFGKAAPSAVKAYTAFFESYVENERGIPYFIDGLARQRGRKNLAAIKEILENGSLKPNKTNANPHWASAHLADMDPPLPDVGDAIGLLETQAGHLDVSWELIRAAREDIRNKCDISRLRFFDENLVAQWHILHGLVHWALELERAVHTLKQKNRPDAIGRMEQSLRAWESIEKGQSIASENPKWKEWYRGDQKMNLKRVKQETEEILQILANR